MLPRGIHYGFSSFLSFAKRAAVPSLALSLLSLTASTVSAWYLEPSLPAELKTSCGTLSSRARMFSTVFVLLLPPDRGVFFCYAERGPLPERHIQAPYLSGKITVWTAGDVISRQLSFGESFLFFRCKVSLLFKATMKGIHSPHHHLTIFCFSAAMSQETRSFYSRKQSTYTVASVSQTSHPLRLGGIGDSLNKSAH